MTLLAIHNAMFMLAFSTAGGFVGGYLIRTGIALPVVILLYATFFLLRLILRMLAFGIVRRLGLRRTMIAALAVIALQYVPLLHADRPVWLIAWLVCMSLGEVMYWPIYHSAVAMSGDSARRGRQLGLRSALISAAAVLGPLLGAVLIANFGPGADFIIGATTVLLAIIPIIRCGEFQAGTIPGAMESLRGADRLSFLLFLIDGWMSSGYMTVWAITYFVLIGARYEAFGMANAAAGLIGCVVSLIGGRWIDRRRHGQGQILAVCAALLLIIAIQAASCWSPVAATVANLSVVAVTGAYVPLLMSSVYERAKRSPAIFRFHLALEAAWDIGGTASIATSALIAWLCPAAYTLAVLPAGLGVVAFALCIRSDRLQTRAIDQPSGTAT